MLLENSRSNSSSWVLVKAVLILFELGGSRCVSSLLSKVLDGLVGESGVSGGGDTRGGSDSSVGITKHYSQNLPGKYGLSITTMESISLGMCKM